MVIIGIFGEPRSGKTLLMTILLYRDYRNGRKILTNYNTTFSELIEPLTLLDFGVKKANIGLDEIHTFIDSRLNSDVNRYFSYFTTQSGKREIKIYYTAQIYSSVDKRMRALTSKAILAEDKGGYFKYTTIDRAGKVSGRRKMAKSKAEKYYPLYNTEEIIYPLELGGGNINFDDIQAVYNASPTKKAFTVTMKQDYPFITGDLISGCYDYLKAEDYRQVRKLLNIRPDQ